MRIWEPQVGAYKNIFFSKNHLVITKLILKSSSFWPALFLYHVNHSNEHYQQITHQTNFQVTARSNPIILDFY